MDREMDGWAGVRVCVCIDRLEDFEIQSSAALVFGVRG